MNLLHAILPFAILAILAIAMASPDASTRSLYVPRTAILSPERANNLVRRLLDAGGCGTNVCFALDGSGSIIAPEFELQKAVVGDMAVVTSTAYDTAVQLGYSPAQPTGLAAVQYGSATSSISAYTTDGAAFAEGLAAAVQMDGQSFVTGGLNYCVRQLFDKPGAGTIVLLGDGLANLGASAARRAALFRAIGGDVVVVAAGLPDYRELLSVVGEDEDKVFAIDAFQNIETLSNVIEQLVQSVCKLPSETIPRGY